MPLLNDYKLSIPKVWEDDWDKALSSATGIYRELIATRKEGAGLLRDIDETHVTTERLGWLNLWSKTFAALQAVTSALDSHSNLILQLVYKNTFELMLQVHTVLDPVSDWQKSQAAGARGAEAKYGEEFAFRSTIERLRAYVAYCLWHDKAYYEEMINPRSFKDVWDFTPPSSVATEGIASEQYGYLLERWESVFRESDSSERKRQMRDALSQKIRRIEQWLVDPSLRRWSAEMKTARTRLKGGVPFFSMFDQSERSIPRRLIKEGLRFGYSSYVMSSMMSHASSMDGFVRINEDSAFPQVSEGVNEIERLAVDLIFRCRHLFILLGVIHHRILSRTELRS
jgi:hypothetical protein